MNYQTLIILCLGLSFCANIIFLGIVYPGLEAARKASDDGSLGVTSDYLYEIYRVNKPMLLKNFYWVDLYVMHGGLIYYFIFIALSTYEVFILTSSIGKTAIFTLMSIVGYKLLMSFYKTIAKFVSNYTIVLSLFFLTSILLSVLLIINLIAMFLH